jgi:hypothetical protein
MKIFDEKSVKCLCGIPWNCMENCLCNSMEFSMEFHGIPLNFMELRLMEFHGIDGI